MQCPHPMTRAGICTECGAGGPAAAPAFRLPGEASPDSLTKTVSPERQRAGWDGGGPVEHQGDGVQAGGGDQNFEGHSDQLQAMADQAARNHTASGSYFGQMNQSPRRTPGDAQFDRKPVALASLGQQPSG